GCRGRCGRDYGRGRRPRGPRESCLPRHSQRGGARDRSRGGRHGPPRAVLRSPHARVRAVLRPVGSSAMSSQSPDRSVPSTDERPTGTPRKPRVLVLFGGRSGEHAISAATAAGVLRAIDRSRYDVVPVGITPSGEWVLAADEPARWEITAGRLPQVEATGEEVILPLSTGRRDLRVLAPGEVPRVLGEVDVVFPLLHGPYGEDGTLQGMLELADVRYVGAGVLA